MITKSYSIMKDEKRKTRLNINKTTLVGLVRRRLATNYYYSTIIPTIHYLSFNKIIVYPQLKLGLSDCIAGTAK